MANTLESVWANHQRVKQSISSGAQRAREWEIGRIYERLGFERRRLIQSSRKDWGPKLPWPSHPEAPAIEPRGLPVSACLAY